MRIIQSIGFLRLELESIKLHHLVGQSRKIQLKRYPQTNLLFHSKVAKSWIIFEFWTANRWAICQWKNIKKKFPLVDCTNLDPGLIFFWTFFHWQIAQRVAVQDSKMIQDLATLEWKSKIVCGTCFKVTI